MPMYFPDFDSLKRRAVQRDFRKPDEWETEDMFRRSFSDFMLKVDPVEAEEILCGRGWDQQSPVERIEGIARSTAARITDEKCSCDHLRSEHNDRFQTGHGSCQECSCVQFTWVAFVKEEKNGHQD